jgi:hypothetical protein
MLFICNLLPISQAGRRGFDPRLPLHLFDNLGLISKFFHSIRPVRHIRLRDQDSHEFVVTAVTGHQEGIGLLDLDSSDAESWELAPKMLSVSTPPKSSANFNG